MDQKGMLIIFIIVAVVGLAVAGINTLKDNISANVNITPTPTPNNLQFNQQTSQTQNTAKSITPQPSKAPVKQYAQFPGSLAPEELQNKKAVIVTDKGKIEFEIYPEATKAASNFIFLTRDGFYNNLTFHRVEPGFVIQGGDPVGDGTGGPGYEFKDEPVTKKYTKGIVAMANAGPNTNGSQFFIMLADHPELPPKYTIFGNVLLGQSIVDSIKIGDVMRKVTIEPSN